MNQNPNPISPIEKLRVRAGLSEPEDFGRTHEDYNAPSLTRRQRAVVAAGGVLVAGLLATGIHAKMDNDDMFRDKQPTTGVDAFPHANPAAEVPVSPLESPDQNPAD